MIDPRKEKVMVYHFEKDDFPYIYGKYDKVPVRIWNGEVEIDFKEVFESVQFVYENEKKHKGRG